MKKFLQIVFIMVLIVVPALAQDQDAMTVTTTGNVGINNPTPRAKLDVNGRIMDKTGFVMPVGTILPYGGTTAPTGWLLCNGTAYARTGVLADLCAIIGTAFGAPDANNFNVPDLRGQFLRGTNSGSGVDPDAAGRTALKTGGNTGDTVGSKQTDGFKAHNHTGTIPAGSCGEGSCSSNAVLKGNVQSAGSTALSIANTGSNETRPKNVNVNFIIKY